MTGLLVRAARVVAGGWSAVRGAWRARRLPGPPATWPATVAFLWRSGTRPPARVSVPAAMDRAALDASFRRYLAARAAEPTVTAVALPPIAVVALVDNSSSIEALAATMREVADVSWQLWLVPVDEVDATRSRSRLPHDPRVRVVGPGDLARDAVGRWLPPGETEFVLFLDPVTVPAPGGVSVVLRAIADTGADWVFTDDARVDDAGAVSDPYLKGGFSPELALFDDYGTRLVVARRAAVVSAGGLDAAMGRAQLQDLLLRLARSHARIHHVDAICAYRLGEVPASPPASNVEVARRALGGPAVADVVADAWPSGSGRWSVLRVRWDARVLAEWPVTIVIPTRDQPVALRTCVASLVRTVDASRTRILVVDDGSEDEATLVYLDELRRQAPLACEVVRPPDRQGFNYARLMNAAAARVTTPLMLHLNDDTEALRPGWLDQMAGWMSRAEVGVVGAKLAYRDGSLQHAGVLVSPTHGTPEHLFRRLIAGDPGYQWLPHRVRNVAAVTGACLLTRVELYNALGGFDAGHFAVQFNDTDYCLRVAASGRRVVYEPAAELYHDEGRSRGRAADVRENAHFTATYSRYRDPFTSPGLDADSLCGPTPLVSAPRRPS